MKCTKRIFIYTLLATILSVSMAFPALAYTYGGAYWHNNVASYQIDSTSVPSSWNTPITNAANTWTNAGTSFSFSKTTSNNKVKYDYIYGYPMPLAYAPITYSGDSMLTARIVINKNYDWSTTQESNKYDVQSVVTHEFGHWLYLSHSSSSSAVMYQSIGAGVIKRTLSSDDINGIVSIYGTKSSSISDKQITNDNKQITMAICSLIPKVTNEELNKFSDTIVTGTVKEILPSKWNTIDGKQPNKPVDEISVPQDVIYTDVVIKVDKSIKNPTSSNEVTVRVVGGNVGNISMYSDMEPTMKKGEKVMLYLYKDNDPNIKNIGPEHFRVTGFYQGKSTITD